MLRTLLQRGASQREVERATGVDRKTIRRYAREANSPGVANGSELGKTGDEPGQIPPPPARPPKEARLACEEQRAWIEAPVELSRNAQNIYQDLVEGGFTPLLTRSSVSCAR